jgi:tRNA(Ile)-lysidine synthase
MPVAASHRKFRRRFWYTLFIMSRKSQTTLLEAVRRTIRAHDMLTPGDTVVVGVSGGPDSVALLHALNMLKPDLDLKIIVAHVDHALRANSVVEAAFVSALARDLGLECRLKRVDVDELSRMLGLSMEETGRRVRYEFFEEVRVEFSADSVATAHHSDDAVETLFLRLIRGSSLIGLRGIAAKRGNITRPLIDCDRARIMEFLKSHDFAFHIDESNLSSKTDRNFMRNRVLPAIAERFPNYRASLKRTMKLLNKENDFLGRLAENPFLEAAQRGDNEISLDLDKLLALDEQIAARVLLKALYAASDDRTRLEEKHIAALLDLLKSGSTIFGMNLPAGLTAVRRYDSLVITRAKADSPPEGFQMNIAGPGTVAAPNSAGKLILDVRARDEVKIAAASADRVYFDADVAPFPLVLRSRLPGDRFRPWGGAGSRKVKEILIDLKIPREDRDKVALLLSRGEIIWIAGVRRSDAAPVTEGTKRVLEIVYEA